jgi:hypothetical protein
MLEEEAKSCAQLRESFCAGPDAGLRRGLPSPSPSPGLGRGPRAAVGGGEEEGWGTRGEDQAHLWVTLSRPKSPCLGDAETKAAGSVRTRLQLKDISSTQAKHTPRPQDWGWGEKLIIIISLMYSVCQKHLRVVQIYHS